MAESQTITFYTDENTPGPVVKQLRQRDIKVVRFLDVHPHETADDLHMDYATRRKYVIVTRDEDFFKLQAERLQQGEDAAGIVFVLRANWEDIRLQLTRLAEIHETETPDSMLNRQEWI